MGERMKPGIFTTQYEKTRKEIDLLKNKKKKNNIEVRIYLNSENSYTITIRYLYLLRFINTLT